MHETRRIELTEQEIRAALMMFVDGSDRFPATRHEIAGIDLGNGMTATIRLHGGKPDIDMNETMMAAAIVFHCITLGVPLARGAKKTVTRERSAYVLMMEI